MLAALLLNLSAATLTAFGETLLAFILWSYAPAGIDSITVVTTLVAIWLMLGLMIVAYQPMAQVSEWLDEYLRRAHYLLEAARDRKVELEQTLNDLAHANRELILLNERLDAMRLIAEEAQRAKTAFVAKISHEFRTPLNMIIGLIDTLTETPDIYGQVLPPELLKDLEIVRRNSDHLASMINDVLDLSQIEAGRVTLHREWVDLAEDIDGAVVVVQPLLEKKNLFLEVVIPDDLPQIYCDKTRIRQVILNLVSNAARYTERGGISLRAARQGQNISVSVTDTGPGIAPQDLDRIFDPFCQGTNSLWRDQGGSGLGLSISKQFIERHNGQIWLESEVGVGSTFFFKLPIFPSQAYDAGPKRWVGEDWVFLERTAWPKIPKLPYKQRIVLCDETGDLYPLFTRHFDDIEFIDAVDLSQTIQELNHGLAHAVILNAASPAELGALVDQARLEITDTPIIGCALPPQTDQILAAGAVDYLIKPVTQADLSEAIQALGTTINRVLIVDDNPDLRQLFTRMLSIYDDALQIFTASSGQEALEKLHKTPLDLILLDIVMPDMDGWQFLECKRRTEAIVDIPVIIVAAEDPAKQPPISKALLATMAPGLSIDQILHFSLHFSKLLLAPTPLAPQPELARDEFDPAPG